MTHEITSHLSEVQKACCKRIPRQKMKVLEILNKKTFFRRDEKFAKKFLGRPANRLEMERLVFNPEHCLTHILTSFIKIS